MTPDGFVTACFMRTNNFNKNNDSFIYGHFDEQNGTLVIDWVKLLSFYKEIKLANCKCENCFNSFHCSKNCPIKCPLLNQNDFDFDCTIEKWIGLANIIETIGYEIKFNNINECSNYFKKIKVTTFGSD